jgi:hypothetical protein
VFYDAGIALAWGRYLEVAPSGWNGAGPDSAQWKTSNTDTPGTSPVIGAGAAIEKLSILKQTFY